MPNPAEDAADKAEARQGLKKITDALGANRAKPYMTVGQSLTAVGIQPRLMPIALGSDDPVDCIVIPVEELMRKEWIHMGGGFTQLNNQDEGEVDG